jgi:hypothetical protein
MAKKIVPQSGVSILELTIILGLMCMVLMILSLIFVAAIRTWIVGETYIKVQEKARRILLGDPNIWVIKDGEIRLWQGLLNELQQMSILLPIYDKDAKIPLSHTKIRFGIGAYIQDGGDGRCDSTVAITQGVADVKIRDIGNNEIFIISGYDGKFRSYPGDIDGDRGDKDNVIEIPDTDDILYGCIIRGPDNVISTTVLQGSDDKLVANINALPPGRIIINPGDDRELQSILGDANGDGDLLDSLDERDPDEYIVREVITYEFKSEENKLIRTVNDCDTSSKKYWWSVVAEDVLALKFSYFTEEEEIDILSDNDINLEDIALICGTLTVRAKKAKDDVYSYLKRGFQRLEEAKSEEVYAVYTVTFRVHPRKLGSAFGGQ